VKSVLFVCTGNICRSPIAEGLFRRMLGNRKDMVMEATATEAPAATQKPAAQSTIGGSVYVKPQDIAWEPTQFEHFDQGPLRGQAEG